MRKTKSNHQFKKTPAHPQDAIFPVGTDEDRKEAHRLPSMVNGKPVYPRAHYEHQEWLKAQAKT